MATERRLLLLHLDSAVGWLADEALCGDMSSFAAAEASVLQSEGDCR